jgi:hypothetical protein
MSFLLKVWFLLPIVVARRIRRMSACPPACPEFLGTVIAVPIKLPSDVIVPMPALAVTHGA